MGRNGQGQSQAANPQAQNGRHSESNNEEAHVECEGGCDLAPEPGAWTVREQSTGAQLGHRQGGEPSTREYRRFKGRRNRTGMRRFM